MSTEMRASRILIIDDNQAIHNDFLKILSNQESDDLRKLNELEAAFLGSTAGASVICDTAYYLDNAFQGQEGFQMLIDAIKEGNPFDMAFVDMRMPPGWDGLETIKRLWEADPDLQIVICTAYSDYTWEEILNCLGTTDKLLILKKPFDKAEVAQIASALTEKRRLSRMAATQMERLEGMVQERTVELQLAVEEANQASVAKSEFLANMSHEIRTPLTSILGYADCFLSGDSADNLTKEQSEAVDVISQSGEHLMNLINGILDLSKIEANKLTFEKLWCSPKLIATEVTDTIRIQAKEKGLELRLSVDSAVPDEIRSDPIRLKQILLNLVGNALKFTSEGSVSLSISVSDNNGITFKVEDTGIGIPKERLDAVFQPFTQADNSTTRRFGGTGLGLTVSKRMAQMLEGDIELTSEPGKGSCFALSIPINEHRPADTKIPIATNDRKDIKDPALTTENVHRLDGLSILLAEDEKINQHLVRTMLTKVGAIVDCADDGQLALEKTLQAWTSGTPYDVVLMDMQMPKIDGYTATQRLRDEGYEGAIVALTAHAMEGDRTKCIEAGCDDYTSKPVRKEIMFPTIHECLRRLSVISTE